MKKTLFISCAILCTCSLGAFGFMQLRSEVPAAAPEINCTPFQVENPLAAYFLRPAEPEFIYDVNPRFLATITKEKLERAESLRDLVPENATDGMRDFKDVKISVFGAENERTAFGTSDQLNPAQHTLLHSISYSTDLYVEATCTYANPRTGLNENYEFVYCITVVPEKQASYTHGEDALLHYLKEKTYAATKNVDLNQLKPGKIRFTVNRDGQLENIYVESTSGREALDKRMMEALKSIPQVWEPAINDKGEKVDQELVFSFGSMGC